MLFYYFSTPSYSISLTVGIEKPSCTSIFLTLTTSLQQLNISHFNITSTPSHSIFLTVGIEKPSCTSIFLAFSTFFKASYKLHRRGLVWTQSAGFWQTSEFRSLCQFIEALRKVLRVRLNTRWFLTTFPHPPHACNSPPHI